MRELVVASRAPRRCRAFQRLLVSARMIFSAAIARAAATGRLTKKIVRQSLNSVRTPTTKDADRAACTDGSQAASLRPLLALEGGHDDRRAAGESIPRAETLARPSGEQGTAVPAIAEASEDAVKMPSPLRRKSAGA